VTLSIQLLNSPTSNATIDIAENSPPMVAVRPSAAAVAGKRATGKARPSRDVDDVGAHQLGPHVREAHAVGQLRQQVRALAHRIVPTAKRGIRKMKESAARNVSAAAPALALTPD